MELQNLNFLTFSIFTILIVVISFIWFKTYKNQISFNSKYKLLATNKQFYIKYIFLILSFAIVLFSIFWLKYWEKSVKNKSNWVDMIFVLDVSKSMNVADINDSKYAYTRLDVVKDSISKFVTNHTDDRFWLVIFSWDAISTVPLTNDHDLFLTLLQNVDYRNLLKQWSDFSKALNLWVDRFNYSDDRSKALIFISDGGDSDDNVAKKEIENISKKVKAINYFVVWVWTTAWWRIITWSDMFGQYAYQQYNWQYVISKINRSNLKDITNALSWEYYEVSDINDLLKLNNSINKLQKKVLENGIWWEKADWWRFLAILSFIFFMIFVGMYLFEVWKVNTRPVL